MPREEKAVNAEAPHRGAADGGEQVRLTTAIMGLARELKRSVPAPREAPYFGLDLDVTYDPTVLESLSSRGIFRKYELVLLIGSGLGGVARWLSCRLGCRLSGVERDVATARAARRLNDAAGMAGEVSFSAGDRGALPFRERVFTHVWMIDPTSQERSTRALAEAFRVLRSGAHFAVQVPGTDAEQVAAVQHDLANVGFTDFSARATTMMPPSHTTGVARARLRAALRTERPSLEALVGEELGHPSSCWQVFCKRP